MKQMIDAELQKLYDDLGIGWKDPDIEEKLKKLKLAPDHKYRDREKQLMYKRDLINYQFKDYKGSGKKVLDMSAGNGNFVEIMKYFGCKAIGTDSPTCKYKPFTKSQGVHIIYFDNNVVPYPIADKSYHLVCNTGAITFVTKIPWNWVLDEMFRIAKETVFVAVNIGENFDANKHLIDDYKKEGWESVLKPDGVTNSSKYKWVKNKPKSK